MLLDQVHQKLTQILEAPAGPDSSFIPETISKWAQSQGNNAVLQSSHNDMVSRLHALGMRMLFDRQLPDDIRAKAIEDAESCGYQLVNGKFVTSDCCIFIQSEERRQALELEAQLKFRMQDLGSLEAARAEIEGHRYDGSSRWPGNAPRVEVPPGVEQSVSGHATRVTDPDVATIPENILRPDVPPQSILNGPQVRRRGQ